MSGDLIIAGCQFCLMVPAIAMIFGRDKPGILVSLSTACLLVIMSSGLFSMGAVVGAGSTFVLGILWLVVALQVLQRKIANV